MMPTVTAPNQCVVLQPDDHPGRTAKAPPLPEAVIFLCLPFLASVCRTFASCTDDPFITLRYAANIVHGFGPVFNRGEHVQGFTSPLHLCVAVLVYLAPGGHDLLKLKLASLVFGLLAIREAGILLYGIDIPRWARRTGVAFASSNGLETTLEMWLLMALTRRLILDGSRRSPFPLALIGFAAVLARPDALLVVAFVGAVGLIIERRRPVAQRVLWLAGPAAAVTGTAAIGLLYFRDALPNTYYAKDIALGQAVSGGARYLHDSLQPQMGASYGRALLILQIAFLAVGVYAVVRRFPRCGYLIAILPAQILFILKSGGDWMNGSRFAAPAAIPMILIEVLGLVTSISYLGRHARPIFVRGVGAVATAGLIASSISSPIFPAPVWQLSGADDRSLLASGGYQYSHLWATLPSYLRCLPAGQLVATSEVGYLGFVRQDLRILDTRGLTGRSIAKGSPESVKFPWGVADPFWSRPTSPVGRVLIRAKPAVIVTFDGLRPESALSGAYRLVEAPASLGASIYVQSSHPGCPNSRQK